MQLTLDQFESKVDKLQSIIYKKIGEYEFYDKELRDSIAKKEALTKNIEELRDSFSFLSSVSKELRTRLVEEIEKLVTMALTKILNNDTLQFKLDFETTASNTNAKCRLLDKNTGIEYDIIDSFGGGVSDIISIALRLISIELWQPKNDLPVFLDECGKFVSSEFQRNFGLFLKEWSKQFNRQIILVSHIKDVSLDADKKIVVSKKGNKSIISY